MQFHQQQSFVDNDKLIVSSLIQRCERTSGILFAIVSVGDKKAREALALERKAAQSSRRARSDSLEGPINYLSGACALYLHALALLKDCLQRTLAVAKGIQPDSQHQTALLKLKQVSLLTHITHD
jgi:hypothetical protein